MDKHDKMLELEKDIRLHLVGGADKVVEKYRDTHLHSSTLTASDGAISPPMFHSKVAVERRGANLQHDPNDHYREARSEARHPPVGRPIFVQAVKLLRTAGTGGPKIRSWCWAPGSRGERAGTASSSSGSGRGRE